MSADILLLLLSTHLICNGLKHDIVVNNITHSVDHREVRFMMSGYSPAYNPATDKTYNTATDKILIISAFKQTDVHQIRYIHGNIHLFSYIQKSKLFWEHNLKTSFDDKPISPSHRYFDQFNVIYTNYDDKPIPQRLYTSSNDKIYYSDSYYIRHTFYQTMLKTISMKTHKMNTIANYLTKGGRPQCLTISFDQKYLYLFETRVDILRLRIFHIESQKFMEHIAHTPVGDIGGCFVGTDNYLYIHIASDTTKNTVYRMNTKSNNNLNDTDSKVQWYHVGILKYKPSYFTELNGYLFSMTSNFIQYLPIHSLIQNSNNTLDLFEKSIKIIPFITAITSCDSIYLFGKQLNDRGCCFDLVQKISFSYNQSSMDNDVNTYSMDSNGSFSYNQSSMDVNSYSMDSDVIEFKMYLDVVLLLFIMCIIFTTLICYRYKKILYEIWTNTKIKYKQ